MISVIIPTLNEAGHLPALLEDLASQQNVTLEILIADGGSTDATRSESAKFRTHLVTSERGRGTQMNSAARTATGDYLLFLHADSRIDDESLIAKALSALQEGISHSGNDEVAGHFSLRFIRSSNRNARAYRYAEEKTTLNREFTTNGDQGLFLSRGYFSRLGGFDESLPFFEDQRIAERIRSQGTWITLPGYLKTSARRFEIEGFHRRYTLMSMMMGLHYTGVDEFFVRAPGIYQVQQHTGKLFLSPFFAVIWQMMRKEWGFFGSIDTFFRLGRYIRQNSWQMFYFFDIWARPVLGPKRYPFLTFHDRIFGPLTDFRLFNAITGMFCFIWFMGILAPFYWLYDYKDMKALPPSQGNQ